MEAFLSLIFRNKAINRDKYRSSSSMQRTRPDSVSFFHPDSGIACISRQETPAVRLPFHSDLQPTAAIEQVQLDSLFELSTLDDFVLHQLTPEVNDLNLLAPARFRETLAATRTDVFRLSSRHRGLSRKLGKLAALLDEQDELVKLAQLYCSALLQG